MPISLTFQLSTDAMFEYRRSSLGRFFIPPGWKRIASGVYQHEQYGTVRRGGRKRKSRWIAEPLGCSRLNIPLITLRSAMIECQLRATDV